VAIYAGGRTGPHAVAATEVLEAVPCDASLADVVAGVIQARETGRGQVLSGEGALPRIQPGAANSVAAENLSHTPAVFNPGSETPG
jgi:hypothetical protein